MEIPNDIVKDLLDYKNKVRDYQQGDMDAFRFKTYRVARGVYEQRDNDTYMVRTRIPGGVLNIVQLAGIASLASKYGQGFIHFTTRQDIQFHSVQLEDTVKVIEGLLDLDIMTKGTGGNTPRNVVTSPLSGVDPDEVFDVTPYGFATTKHLVADASALNLPRKYKIGYSNSPADTGNATISDLGFIATYKDGKQGFQVFGGGGLGSNAKIAIELYEFIPKKDVLYHVQAMKELFEAEGDRSNKHRARLRYVVERLGEYEFANRYQAQVEQVKQKYNLDVVIPVSDPKYGTGSISESNSPLVFAQKQVGYYSLYVHPYNANLQVADLNKLVTVLSSLDYEVSLRVTNTQGLYVRDLKGEDIDNLVKVIADYSSSYFVENSVACTGAATCKLGLCLSQNLLAAIQEKFATQDASMRNTLPRVFISGCPNSCGQHQKGVIGLSGKARRTSEGLVPLYTVHLGGRINQEKPGLAEVAGDLPAKKIPQFLVELAQMHQASGIEQFEQYLVEKRSAIDELIDSFSTIESFKENPDLYYDFGAEELFSLKGRGPGECSAGVLDVIKLDINNAQDSLQAAELYDASLSAARALLVLKGIDTNKDREILQEFIVHFVDTGYVKDEAKDLVNALIDFKLGDIKSLQPYYDEISYLVERVKAMYESLNPKLEITVEFEGLEQIDEVAATTEAVDLRGVKCPLNFVKVKVALAPLESGDVIGFYLDNGEPMNNVPKSAQAEGHKIVSAEQYDDYSLLTIKKK